MSQMRHEPGTPISGLFAGLEQADRKFVQKLGSQGMAALTRTRAVALWTALMFACRDFESALAVT